ncbi:MAG: hypothetical protein ACM3H7_00300 [Acidobacteriaceae bacterium]
MSRHQLPERNPKTHALHRREVFWQITLPLLVAVLLLLAAVAAIIFSALQPVTELDRWADVSLIWIIMPALFFTLILLVMLVGLGYAISLILRVIPRYAHRIQIYFELGKNKTARVTNLLTTPIIKTRAALAVISQLGKWRRPSAGEN